MLWSILCYSRDETIHNGLDGVRVVHRRVALTVFDVRGLEALEAQAPPDDGRRLQEPAKH